MPKTPCPAGRREMASPAFIIATVIGIVPALAGLYFILRGDEWGRGA